MVIDQRMFLPAEVVVLLVCSAYFFIAEAALRFIVWGSKLYTLPVLSRKLVGLLGLTLGGETPVAVLLTVACAIPLVAAKLEEVLVSRHFGWFLVNLYELITFRSSFGTFGFGSFVCYGLYEGSVSTLGTPSFIPKELQFTNAVKAADQSKMHPIDLYFYVRLKTPVDAVFVRPLFSIVVASVPFLLAIFLPHFWFSWTVVLMHMVYVGTMGILIESVYHWNLHNFIFYTNSKYERDILLNGFLRVLCFWLLYLAGPLFGYVPHVYDVTHRLCHHREDNTPADFQSVVTFDRCSFVDFTFYMIKIGANQATGITAVPYMWGKGFRRQCVWMLFGVFGFYSFLGVLLYFGINSVGTGYNYTYSVLMYVIPLLTAGLSVARGVYSWHAFVEPVSEKDYYASSNVFLNSKYFMYNDNLHTEHHKKAGLHWSKLDESFQKSKQDYVQNKANSFDTSFLAKPILFYLWYKRFDLIADHYIPIDPSAPIPRTELLRMFERRTLPLGGKRPTYSTFRQHWEKACLWLVAKMFIDDINSSGWDWNKSQDLPQ